MPMNRTLLGILSALGAAACFSVNDVSIKFLSGDYALHQVVLVRSLVGMVFILAVLVPLYGGLQVLRTQRIGMHVLRGICVVFSNLAYFMALSVMPIAEAVAIFFVAPLVTTVFSVVFLGEAVGPRRWLAVVIGLIGVLVVMRPGSGAFQPAALLVLAAATSYAALLTFTRHIGGTEQAATMAFYIQLSFVLTSGLAGLALGQGQFQAVDDGVLAFVTRPWVWPGAADLALMALTGLASGFGGFLISQAYRLCEAGLAAPFEYVALPMSVFWGITVFGEWPDIWSLTGICMILGGGLYMIWRETVIARSGR